MAPADSFEDVIWKKTSNNLLICIVMKNSRLGEKLFCLRPFP